MFASFFLWIAATCVVYHTNPPRVGVGNTVDEAIGHMAALNEFVAANEDAKLIPGQSKFWRGYTAHKGDGFLSLLYGEISDLNIIRGAVARLRAAYDATFDQKGQIKTETQSIPEEIITKTDQTSKKLINEPIVPFGPSGAAANVLSNYDRTLFRIGDRLLSGEYYFQLAKFKFNSIGWLAVFNARTPNDARKAARCNYKGEPWTLDDGLLYGTEAGQEPWTAWGRASKFVMARIVSEKYLQNSIIQKFTPGLCVEDTGDRAFNSQDRIWGVGADGIGENQLGLLWTLRLHGYDLRDPLIWKNLPTILNRMYQATAKRVQDLYPQYGYAARSAMPAPVAAPTLSLQDVFSQIGEGCLVRCVGYWGGQTPKELWIVAAHAFIAKQIKDLLPKSYIHSRHETCVIVPWTSAAECLKFLGRAPLQQGQYYGEYSALPKH